MSKQIFIAGGSGLLGQFLERHFDKNGYKVTILSRSGGSHDVKYPDTPEELAELISGASAVINLAGASVVGKRWNKAYKKVLYDSRIKTTKYLVEAINIAEVKPQIFISASAVGYYGDAGDKELTEDLDNADGFIAELCRDWEAEAKKANVPTFIPRIGIVLTKDGGALKEMLTPFKFFIGGPIGSGKQWFPWVHILDVFRIFKFAIEENLEGTYNIASPYPVRMSEFAKTLGKVMNRPSLFKVPGFVLKIILGESAQEVMRSQKVIPKNLTDKKLTFQYPHLKDALSNILKG